MLIGESTAHYFYDVSSDADYIVDILKHKSEFESAHINIFLKFIRLLD